MMPQGFAFLPAYVSHSRPVQLGWQQQHHCYTCRRCCFCTSNEQTKRDDRAQPIIPAPASAVHRANEQANHLLDHTPHPHHSATRAYFATLMHGARTQGRLHCPTITACCALCPQRQDGEVGLATRDSDAKCSEMKRLIICEVWPRGVRAPLSSCQGSTKANGVRRSYCQAFKLCPLHQEAQGGRSAVCSISLGMVYYKL